MESTLPQEGFEQLTPIDENWIQENPGELQPIEKKFAELLLTKASLLLYRGPNLNGSNPDFFVFNTEAQRGRVVEVSLLFSDPEIYEERGLAKPERKTLQRKDRQRSAIINSGLPYSFIHREHLEKIRKNQKPDLF